MKLLICTQKIDKNDDNLGFFHRWVEEFAKHTENLTVICLYEGEHNLPSNVTVLSLGKEKRQSRLHYLKRFYSYIWKYRRDYDTVFVHMNPEYVVLGGILWRLWRKRVALWYTHRHADIKLRIAHTLVNKIFSASPDSFPLTSKKVLVFGHGIDPQFSPPETFSSLPPLKILVVGRISRSKHLETLLEACTLLTERKVSFETTLVGAPITDDDREHEQRLKRLVREYGLGKSVVFVGPRPHRTLPSIYRRAHVYVNQDNVGGLNKTPLEAMASGVPVVTSNPAYESLLGEYRGALMFTPGDAKELAERFLALLEKKNQIVVIGKALERVVRKQHSLKSLIPRIVSSYERISS